MCFGYCVVSSLLSAVNGTTHFIVVCGIGIVIMTPVWLLPQSELDHLYNWDLVCAFRLFTFRVLSAVLGLIFLVVVCGVGIVTTTQLIRTSTSELDHLYYVGLGVCSSVVHTFGSCRRYVLGLFALWFVVLEL